MSSESSTAPRLTRRRFLRHLGRLAALSAGGFVYADKIEPGWLDVNHLSFTLPHLHRAFDSYTIAQISDIHMDWWMTRARLERVVQVINAQTPDLIAVTGDFVTEYPERFAADLIAALSQLRARDGVVGVLGNHDYWTRVDLVRDVMHQSGIQNLDNRAHSIRRGEAVLQIAGVDDVWAGTANLPLLLGRMPQDGAAILLVHEPDFADVAAQSGRFDLQLSGHSHGGQIRLPFVGPLLTPRLAHKYRDGQYTIGNMILHINRGLGMVGPHLRFNCRPEISVLTLHSP